jgi:hypothetical protein
MRGSPTIDNRFHGDGSGATGMLAFNDPAGTRMIRGRGIANRLIDR